MKRAFVAVAAVALLLVTTNEASAFWRTGYGYGANYGYYPAYYSYPVGGVGLSYSTRVGNTGVFNVGYSAPVYGYTAGYYAPAFYGYQQPVYGGYYGGYRWGGVNRWGW
jgi:hypothetical protein